MSDGQDDHGSDASDRTLLAVCVGASVVGLILGGVGQVLGEQKALTGGAVALGATTVTLYALAEVDSQMKNDLWLRIARAATTILAAWAVVGAALANGLQWAWGFGVGALLGLYLMRRGWTSAGGDGPGAPSS